MLMECTQRYLELLAFLVSDLLPVRSNRSEPLGGETTVQSLPASRQTSPRNERNQSADTKIDGNAR